jgi:hypothetical protein
MPCVQEQFDRVKVVSVQNYLTHHDDALTDELVVSASR